MPEGHSIHRLASQLSSVFGGKRLAASSPQGRFAAGAAGLNGRVLIGADAHGKQLFVEFADAPDDSPTPPIFLRVHLGLYGAWSFGGDRSFMGASSIGAPRRVGERELDGTADAAYSGPPDPVGAVRLRLASDAGWADLRGPTACEVITGPERDAVVDRLGPDPLHNDTSGDDVARFTAGVRKSASPLGLLLMNQAVIAGVGNIYRAEALFRRNLNPRLPGKSVSAAEASALWQDIGQIMRDGVRDGRIITTLAGDRSSKATRVKREDAHYVYGRAGLPCRRCGTPVALADLAARKLYWCPRCQAP
ncbi:MULTISPECIES: Fpg/Nei family DNA glycosylase [unclassified Arthrobacter]|uniref:Fpg/Nei family DNA glycosylase n=1 Tax=unclassified Arthrobacter TaxID=235627 RepID=UPI0014920763|nr:MULTISPECIES: Fpg/Nei family DNA glycosylase [unclassified Arthrobacter]MBE0010214.1 Fpg/Nei family DNA glycosylase [Arthrobacter sp. AET 35A]NOJ64030.1 Fpg/Nei family DNA glycosylase [Arthrobacter sp. 147(2020)]